MRATSGGPQVPGGGWGPFKRFPGVTDVDLCSAASPRVRLAPLVSGNGFVSCDLLGPFLLLELS